MEKIERNLPPVTDADGMVNFYSVSLPSDNSIAVCENVPNRVIPVIFVPGIMGSNLASSSGKGPVWHLDNLWTIGSEWTHRGAKK